MSRLQGLLFALATVVLVAVSTFYFTKEWLPPLKSDRADIDSALWWSLLVTGLVFIATNLILAWLSWRYTDRPGARASHWHDDPKLEWGWTAATAAIMFVFMFNALGLWAEISKDPPPDAMLVEVTGQQFAWNVRYPGKDGILGRTDHKLASQENPIGVDPGDGASADDVRILNNIVLVKDRPVRVQVRSMDVLHSFFLPNYRVKQDALPGMTVQIWFTPRELTDPAKPLEIACAEHCGLGHYRMRGMVHVVSAADFDAKVAEFAQ
jgi:cytochrome c oxidase subunit II